MIFKETKPIYLQIADRLCDEILERTYRAEERIPSVREYAAVVEVNVNTVVRTYEHLQQRGIIYNKRGLGFFVAPTAVDEILDRRRETFLHEELPTFFNRINQLGITLEEIARLYELSQSTHRDCGLFSNFAPEKQ